MIRQPQPDRSRSENSAISLPTATQITQALQLSGWLTLSNRVTSFALTEQFQGYADQIVRLQLSFANPNQERLPQTIICKVFGPQWYMLSGLPELQFYRDRAARMPPIPVPTFYGGSDDALKQQCFLLIEDLANSYERAQLPLAEHWLDRLTDFLVALHAQWWQHPDLTALNFMTPEQSVMRMTQALDAAGIQINRQYADQALHAFVQKHGDELTSGERSLLALLSNCWAAQFAKRVANGKNITLIHSDFHLLGNVFLAKAETTSPQIKIIDWTQAKRGLGTHDLMYMLLVVDARDRVSRDLRFIARYYGGLQTAGIADYPYTQCLWDFRFSLLTNIFQSLFQDSMRWFRKSVEVASLWQCDELLGG